MTTSKISGRGRRRAGEVSEDKASDLRMEEHCLEVFRTHVGQAVEGTHGSITGRSIEGMRS